MRISARPPVERIAEILTDRAVIARRIKSYQTRRDFLQLCAELDYLQLVSIDQPQFDSVEVAG